MNKFVVVIIIVILALGLTSYLMYTTKTSKMEAKTQEELKAPELSVKSKIELLEIARKTIESYVRNGTIPQFNVTNPELLQNGAAFVTIKENGELRGCIGHLVADRPLYKTVIEMSIAAATQDPRFPPLREEELNNITIEISVLSKFKKIEDPNSVIVGKHGLLIKQGFRQGLLLPQVPVEYGWDRQTFLEQTCFKAGLLRDCWKYAELYVFTANVFSEEDFGLGPMGMCSVEHPC